MYLTLPYKSEFTFDQRFEEAKRVMAKYPDRIPIICERSYSAGRDCPNIDKKKYLVPRDLTLGQFLYVIRKRLKLSPDKALFLFINNNIPSSSCLISQLYSRYKDKDAYLYITYSQENTFG